MITKREIALQLTLATIENKNIVSGTTLLKPENVYNFYNEIYKNLNLQNANEEP